MTERNYRLVTKTETGNVVMGTYQTLEGAIYSMGLDHGYDIRVSEDHGENPNGVSWIEARVNDAWIEQHIDLT